MALPGVAHAQPSTAYVSNTGADNASCGFATAPCRTFQFAHDRVGIGGEIRCRDACYNGGNEQLSISKSVSIDGGEASLIQSSTGFLSINIDIAASAGDTLRFVHLRNFNLHGMELGTRTGTQGIRIARAINVFIDNVRISAYNQHGILDTNAVTGSRTFIRNTVIENIGGPGIVSTGVASHAMVVENVRSVSNTFGIAIANGNDVMMARSVMSGNSIAGVEADPGARLRVNDTVITHNGTGVMAFGTVRLSNSDISFNGTGISGLATSFGNNRISDNVSDGTAPNPFGSDSHDKGQR
jgi:hypothetical protein